MAARAEPGARRARSAARLRHEARDAPRSASAHGDRDPTRAARCSCAAPIATSCSPFATARGPTTSSRPRRKRWPNERPRCARRSTLPDEPDDDGARSVCVPRSSRRCCVLDPDLERGAPLRRSKSSAWTHPAVRRDRQPLLRLSLAGQRPRPQGHASRADVSRARPRARRRETFDRLEVFDGLECDLHEPRSAQGALAAAARQRQRARAHSFAVSARTRRRSSTALQALARGAVSKRFADHYRGFFQGMCREHERSERRKAKTLLYAYRVALTGVHLLRTGELIGDVGDHRASLRMRRRRRARAAQARRGGVREGVAERGRASSQSLGRAESRTRSGAGGQPSARRTRQRL